MFLRSTILVSILLFFVSTGYCYREVYRIGAILDVNEENVITLENAFNLAVNDINESDDYEFRFEGITKIIRDEPYEAMVGTCSLMESDVIGIFGPFQEDNSNVVQSISDAKEIPHIEVRWDDYPLNGTIVNVHPFPDVLTGTYIDLIREWGWKNFVILYENNESLQRVGELLKMFNPTQHRIAVRQLKEEYRTVLKELWRSGATHFVLDCTTDILPEVLRQAQQVGLMTNKQHYIITNLDLHTIDLTSYQYAETNITGMRFVDPDEPNLRRVAAEVHNLGVGMELVAGWRLALQDALLYDAVTMFAKAIKEAGPIRSSGPIKRPTDIRCSNDKIFSSGTSIINYMRNTEYEGLTGIVKFHTTGFRKNFALDIIELTEGGVNKVGVWNSSHSDPLVIMREYPPPDTAELDIRNRTFRVIITLTEPYGMEKESYESLQGNNRYEGFAVDLIELLSQLLGFNYTFIVRPSRVGTYNNATDKWDGIIGDLHDGTDPSNPIPLNSSWGASFKYACLIKKIVDEFCSYRKCNDPENVFSGKCMIDNILDQIFADLAITDLTITAAREEAVDFTSPFMMLGIDILYQKPTEAPPSFFSFADPFAFEVWVLLMAACVGVSFILFIVGRISPSEWENPYPCIEEPEYLMNQLDLRNCAWFVTGSIMQQGSEIELKSVSTRMVAGMWWFFTLLMVSSYTANLAAFLTTETPDPHFRNYKELIRNAEEKGIKYGAKAGGATANFFKDNAEIDKDFAKAYQFMQDHKDEVLVPENKDGVSKALEGFYAFFMESSSIEYVTYRECDLYRLNDPLDEKGYGIAMRKNESYRKPLSTAILKLQNNGEIERIKNKWWKERRGAKDCQESENDEGDGALDPKNVSGVFYVTIFGTILAFLMALVETSSSAFKKSAKAKLPFKTALWEEVKFYFRFSEMVKPVHRGGSSHDSDSNKLRSEEKELPYSLVNKQLSVETLESYTNSNKSKRSKKSRKAYKKQMSNVTV